VPTQNFQVTAPQAKPVAHFPVDCPLHEPGIKVIPDLRTFYHIGTNKCGKIYVFVGIWDEGLSRQISITDRQHQAYANNQPSFRTVYFASYNVLQLRNIVSGIVPWKEKIFIEL